MSENPQTESSGFDTYWFCAKLMFVIGWVIQTQAMVKSFSLCPFPIGICRIYDFNFLFSGTGVYVTYGLIFILSLLYLLEVSMRFVTLGGLLLSMIIISHHESNGVFHRTTAFSMIWFGQSLAYFLHYYNRERKLEKDRLDLSIQFIAAIYTLSGISKLLESGLRWPRDGARNIDLVIIKSANHDYHYSGNKDVFEHAYDVIHFFHTYPDVVAILLTIAIIVELTSLLSILNHSIKELYGVLFLFMHIGIFYFLDIKISAQILCMIAFFLNPLYKLYEIKNSLLFWINGEKEDR